MKKTILFFSFCVFFSCADGKKEQNIKLDSNCDSNQVPSIEEQEAESCNITIIYSEDEEPIDKVYLITHNAKSDKSKIYASDLKEEDGVTLFYFENESSEDDNDEHGEDFEFKHRYQPEQIHSRPYKISEIRSEIKDSLDVEAVILPRSKHIFAMKGVEDLSIISSTDGERVEYEEKEFTSIMNCIYNKMEQDATTLSLEDMIVKRVKFKGKTYTLYTIITFYKHGYYSHHFFSEGKKLSELYFLGSTPERASAITFFHSKENLFLHIYSLWYTESSGNLDDCTVCALGPKFYGVLSVKPWYHGNNAENP